MKVFKNVNTNKIVNFGFGLLFLSTISNANAWTLVYENDAAGKTKYGSVSALTNAIQQGHEVRISHDVGFGGSIQYVTCDEVTINPDKSVACSHTRDLSNRSPLLGTDFGFQDDIYHVFFMVNTKGQRDRVRWSVGEHTDRGHDNPATAVKWFID